MTLSGSVAVFTSDRPFAQAHDDTSHMKENTAVTTKSCRSQTKTRHRLQATDGAASAAAGEQADSRSGGPCCSHGTSPERSSRRRGLPWSRGRKRRRWWRRTRPRRSSPPPGTNARGFLPYRWGRQSKPDGAWEQQREEASEREEAAGRAAGRAAGQAALTWVKKSESCALLKFSQCSRKWKWGNTTITAGQSWQWEQRGDQNILYRWDNVED